jgi:crotonobetainyl-CoA:carnitine CoA-transferase CaiB-like acyl-CoA transferase
MVLKDGRDWDHLGVPIRFSHEPGKPDFAPPAHGQHSREILRTLGYRDSEIVQLVARGVVNAP